MGASNSGILVYGYDLDTHYGYVERDEARETLEAADPLKAAEIELVAYSYEMECTFLAAVWFEAYQGGPTEVDFTVPEGADERLAWAVGVLGLKVDGAPKWLLGSEW